MEVSGLALGTAGFGTTVPRDDAFAILQAFTAAGGNLLDTANIYGRRSAAALPASERTIGEWLGHARLRETLVICTKGGAPPDRAAPGRLSRRELEHDLDDSRHNLGVDRIDLYWLHRDNPSLSPEAIGDTLLELRSKGWIRYFGLSNFSADRTRAVCRYCLAAGWPVAAIQKMWSAAVPNPTALADEQQTVFDLDDLWVVRQFGLPLVAYSPQAAGYFSHFNQSGFCADAIYRYERQLFENAKNRARGERLAELGARYKCSATQIALKALLESGQPVLPVVGPRSVSELHEAIDVFALRPDHEVELELRMLLVPAASTATAKDGAPRDH